MEEIYSFIPLFNCVNIPNTGTGGSDRVALGNNAGIINPTVRVVNDSDKTQFIVFGSSTVTSAAATGTPVMAGEDVILGLPAGTVYVASVAGVTATGNIYFQVGRGN